MEPWDGPAAVAFTDGRQIGATLDRNGLRPCALLVTDDDLIVIMASESGVLPIKEDNIVRKWRLQPGKMLLIDLEQGRIIEDEEIKASSPRPSPTRNGSAGAVQAQGSRRVEPELAALPVIRTTSARSPAGLRLYAGRHLKFLSRWPRATIRSARWAPTRRLRCCRRPSRLLYDYFKQNFAQVTNPPIDPIREELVMSLVSMIGPRPNLLGHDAGSHKRLEVASRS
jgi:glutamate synthase (NADPH/NADH) large chain